MKLRKITKTMFNIWNSSSEFETLLKNKKCKTTSIDIGSKNFCIRIEKDRKLIFTANVEFESYDKQLKNLNKYFNTIYDYLENTNIVIVERQLSTNIKAYSLMLITLAYFINNKHVLADDYIISTVSPKLKNIILNPKKEKITKYRLKKLSIEKALEISKERKCEQSISILTDKVKKDDYADVLVQLQAMYIYFNF